MTERCPTCKALPGTGPGPGWIASGCPDPWHADFDRDLEADLEDARMRDWDDQTSLLEDNR
jgi:hypothetical protein